MVRERARVRFPSVAPHASADGSDPTLRTLVRGFNSLQRYHATADGSDPALRRLVSGFNSRRWYSVGTVVSAEVVVAGTARTGGAANAVTRDMTTLHLLGGPLLRPRALGH